MGTGLTFAYAVVTDGTNLYTASNSKTLKHEAKGGKLEELRKETRKDGTVVYEAEIVKAGKGRDIEVSADGKVIGRGKTHDEKAEHEHERK